MTETEKLTKSIREEMPDDDTVHEPKEIKNPFVHKVEWNDPWDKIRTALFTVLVLPIRTIFIVFLLFVSWVLASIGLYGLTREDLKSRPITGWRRNIQLFAALIMRTLYWTGSFHYIRYKGVRATPRQAPIICAAPHTSFYDSILVIVLGPSSVVAKSETSSMPFFGKLIDYTQPIYVCREDPDSRQNTIKEINERATSKEDWSQVLIFPEGTCTNRTSLIHFKPGAFIPGVPVQPVVIRYPNQTDTVTWTWEGPEVLTLLWRTLTQVHTYCEIEFLPIHTPTEEEKKDAKLFARNVQKEMAESLGIPISDYSFEDCRLMNIAKQMKIPHCADVADAAKLRKSLDLDKSNPEEKLVDELTFEKSYRLTLSDFAKRLQISDQDVSTIKLFNLFATPSPQIQQDDVADLGEYLLCALFLITLEKPKIQLVELLFKFYGKSGEASQETFYEITKHVLKKKYNKDKSDHLFQQIDKSQNGFVTFDDFHDFTRLNPEYTFLLDKVSS